MRSVKYMSKLTQTFKGQIKRETDKALQVTVIGDEIFDTWIPKSAINKNFMPSDYLLNESVQEFNIMEWFVKMKANEKKDEVQTKTEFLGTAQRISTEKAEEPIPRIPDTIYGKLPPNKPAPEIKTQTVIIPAQPDHRPYFPNMTIFELRDYHLRENNGAIRGHIENIIMAKIREDLLSGILEQLQCLDRLMRMMMEEKK